MKDENGHFITAAVIPDTGPSVALVSDPPGLPTSIRFLSVPVALDLADQLRKAAELASETGCTEDDEVLAAKYALACARRAHPGLVDDAALSLWEEDVDAESVRRAYLDGLSVCRSQAAYLAQARAFSEALRADIWRMWQGEWGPYDESDADKWPLPWDGDETVVQTRAEFWAQGGDRKPSAFSLLLFLGVTKVTQLDT